MTETPGEMSAARKRSRHFFTPPSTGKENEGGVSGRAGGGGGKYVEAKGPSPSRGRRCRRLETLRQGASKGSGARGRGNRGKIDLLDYGKRSTSAFHVRRTGRKRARGESPRDAGRWKGASIFMWASKARENCSGCEGKKRTNSVVVVSSGSLSA